MQIIFKNMNDLFFNGGLILDFLNENIVFFTQME
jgi:hypothetical protein